MILLFVTFGIMHFNLACPPSKDLTVCDALKGNNQKWLRLSVEKESRPIDLQQADEKILQAIVDILAMQKCVKTAETGREIVQTLPPTAIIKVVFIQDTLRLEKLIDLFWTKKEIVVRQIR